MRLSGPDFRNVVGVTTTTTKLSNQKERRVTIDVFLCSVFVLKHPYGAQMNGMLI